ncbi:hypothetical protein [Nocardia aurantiaca]|uniref:Uncharacterized protein n=1 Tax=Nocardia aurantiaca TaxID=2675850 RepID=A0A6I3L306_9NOCA|nr:hypothetical protein [Nocardia aurantiaca]MTE16247.1 hypothetical protein [Nocardia aurantiaca]
MSAVISALIAVAGTLLGSGATFLFQRITADRAAGQAAAERLRQDRLNAYNAFADMALEYRRTQIDRWYRIQEGGPDIEEATRAESYTKRTALRSALLRVQLLTSDTRLHELGSKIIEVTQAIHRAADLQARNERGDESKAMIDAFVKHAAIEVQSALIALVRVGG